MINNNIYYRYAFTFKTIKPQPNPVSALNYRDKSHALSSS